MFPNVFRSNLNSDVSTFKIIKNIVVISLSFFFIFSADDGIIMLQSTMNKVEGIGTVSLAVTFSTYGLTSLILSSFLVKKLGAKNSQLLGITMMLPYIASNIYPTWITLLPSAVFRGFGACLLWAAQCTYFNESSVLLCRIDKKERKHKSVSNLPTKGENFGYDKEMTSFKPYEQDIENLSALNLLRKPGNSLPSNRNSNLYLVGSSTVKLTAYRQKKDESDLSEIKYFSSEKNDEITKQEEGHYLKIFHVLESPKAVKNVLDERKGYIDFNAGLENHKEIEESIKYQSYVDSTKSFYFGIHGLAYQSAAILSCLISYFILKKSDDGYYYAASTSCGANFCSSNMKGFTDSLEVPNNTRYLLVGVYMACGVMAPMLIFLCLDGMGKSKRDVKLSWNHVLATIKYIKKKDQLLLIPFTIGATFCKGFYMADFTKSYIACAWNLSQIGLITVVYGVTSALSSLLSGVFISYVGRKSFMVSFQIFTITNFVFLLFWKPDAQQPYMFYVQGGIFGVISGIFNSQTKALYGILFEGDEETAFSSYNLYTSIGWAPPFIFHNFLCTSVKIYAVLVVICVGLLGYLLTERSYSLRIKELTT